MKLRKNYEFRNVYKNGGYYADRFLVLYAVKNNLDVSRFGISAGKKVGKSVVRNRVTRLIREAIRRNVSKIKPGRDIIILARAGSGEISLAAAEESLAYLINKSRLNVT